MKQQPPKKPAPAASRQKPMYPTEPLADEAEVEFLRSIADICNARADEVEEAKAKRHAR